MALFVFAFLGLGHAGLRQLAHGRRATPFDMNPNAFGQVLALTLVCALTVYLSKAATRFVRLACIGGIVAASLGIVISGSREALIGGFLGFSFLLLRGHRQETLLPRIATLLLPALCVIAAYQATSQFQRRFDPVFSRMETITAERSLTADENLSARLELSEEAMDYYVDDPIFLLSGRGLRATDDAMTVVQDTDSAFLNSANAFGIFGVLAIVSYYVSYWRQARRLATGQTGERVWGHGIAAALITYLTIGLAANVFGSPHTTIVVLCVISIGMVSGGPIAGQPLLRRASSQR